MSQSPKTPSILENLRKGQAIPAYQAARLKRLFDELQCLLEERQADDPGCRTITIDLALLACDIITAVGVVSPKQAQEILPNRQAYITWLSLHDFDPQIDPNVIHVNHDSQAVIRSYLESTAPPRKIDQRK
jgi:hypothetical protein